MNVLDTDSLTLLMRGHKGVTRRAATTTPIAITLITRVEILRGRFASILKAPDGNSLLLAQDWLRKNEELISGLVQLPVDAAAAARFDLLRKDRRLRRVGHADLMIASIVIANRATLITRNVRDFQQIPGLSIENWAD